MAEGYRRLEASGAFVHLDTPVREVEIKSHFQPALMQVMQAGLSSSHFLCLALLDDLKPIQLLANGADSLAGSTTSADSSNAPSPRA